MKIKEGFVVCEVSGRILAVATGETSKTFHGMITLNKSGRFLWEQLSQNRTKQQLLDALMDKYEIDINRAQQDLDTFIIKLKDAGILDEQ